MDNSESLLLVDKYFKNTQEREFEVTLKINQQQQMTLLQHMSSLYKNKRGIKSIENVLTLDIVHMKDQKKHRISVTDDIQMNTIKYIVANFENKNNHFVFNQVLRLPDKDMQKNIHFEQKYIEDSYVSDEYGYHAKISVERPLKKTQLTLKHDQKENIVYRLKQRNRIHLENGIMMDLTQVSMTKDLQDLLNKDALERSKKFEVELELPSSLEKQQLKDIKKALDDQLLYLYKVIRSTPYILKKSLQKQVIDNFLAIAQVPHMNRVIRKPISMQLTHVSEQITQYAVTDKADGERHLLFIFENDVYLISMNHDVIFTGLTVNSDLNGTIADGEKLYIYKYQKHLFLVFDVLFIGNKDIRQEPFHQVRMKQFNDSFNKSYGTYFDFKNSTQDTLNEYFKKQLTTLQKNVVETSIEKKRQTMIMNKFFAYPKGTENDIFKMSLMVHDTHKQQSSYPLDGLMYHPVEQTYTTDQKQNKYSELKWKPDNKNSIDFYIKFKKDTQGQDIIAFDRTQSDIEDKYYKICYLFVDSKDQPIPFKVQPYIHLYVDQGLNEVIDQEGIPIYDQTIVEFNFDIKNKHLDTQNRWIPLRTRYDKTQTMRETKSKYGNNEFVAQSVWNSMSANFSIDDIQVLSSKDLQVYQNKMKQLRSRISKKDILEMNTKQAYYNPELSDIAKPMKQFHNFVKSQLIYTYFNKQFNNGQPHSILDLACGRGGDILKMYYVSVKQYVGVDIDYNGLMSQVDGAIKRYDQIKSTKPNMPKMFFLQGDMGYPLTFRDQDRAFGGQLDNEFKGLYNKFFPVDPLKRKKFTSVNCQFAIHYILKNEQTWNNFKQTLNDYLEDDGYFMCTTLDGDMVHQMISQGQIRKEYTNKKGQNQLLFEILPEYNVSKLNKSKTPLGQQINVYQAWIADEHRPEYLVFKEYLISELLRDCGLQLIDDGSFGDMYQMHRDFLMNHKEYESVQMTKQFLENVSKYYNNDEVNKHCRTVTDLSRYYIFKKVNKSNIQKGGGRSNRTEKHDVMQLLGEYVNQKYNLQTLVFGNSHSFYYSVFEVIKNRGQSRKQKITEIFQEVFIPDEKITQQYIQSFIDKHLNFNILMLTVKNNKIHTVDMLEVRTGSDRSMILLYNYDTKQFSPVANVIGKIISVIFKNDSMVIKKLMMQQ